VRYTRSGAEPAFTGYFSIQTDRELKTLALAGPGKGLIPDLFVTVTGDFPTGRAHRGSHCWDAGSPPTYLGRPTAGTFSNFAGFSTMAGVSISFEAAVLRRLM
jgi:hypothetical protein